MDEKEIKTVLWDMEVKSQPRLGYPSKTISKVINGHEVKVSSKWNRGRSGKLFTSLFYVDGKRVARVKVIEELLKEN